MSPRRNRCVRGKPQRKAPGSCLPGRAPAKNPHRQARGPHPGAFPEPRPGYQHDPNRRYGFNFAGFDVRFQIDGDTLTVVEIVAL
ncbi:MAG: hypothetical protein ACLR8U_08170 [Oscillospiraceae bacterium]